MTTEEHYDFIIIGAGVAGLAAAMYAARLGLKTLCLGASHGSEMPIGGVITTTLLVENYPGFIKTSGRVLADSLKAHALEYPLATLKEEKVEDVQKTEKNFIVRTTQQNYSGKTILFATGTARRKLDVRGSKEFEHRGVCYCALCQPPGEEIIANGDITPIGRITPLTRVLTNDGSYQDVGGFSKRHYEGELISIKPRFFVESTKLTPEHLVLTTRVRKGIGKNYLKDFKIEKPVWKKARELDINDCVLYPILKETKDARYFRLSDYLELRKYEDKVIPHKKTFTSHIVKNEVALSKDLMRLFGYYLAEGSVVKHELRFYFAKKEINYQKDVVKIIKDAFGLDAKISYKDNVGVVSLYSKIICDFFKVLFDKYSYQKKLPQIVMHLPLNKQKELIKGLWRGDGCLREKDFCIVTNSRKLAYQTRDILLRLGIICSLQMRNKDKLNKKPHQIEGRDVSFTHDKYHISIGGHFLDKMSEILEISHLKLKKRKFSTNHAWIKDNMVVLPIREIERINYKGDVLSMSVKNSNSYVAKNFIVHNCDAPLYKNKVVAVVGGSDSAVADALILTTYAKKVYIIYRKEKLRAEPANVKRVESDKKIEIINNANIVEIKGEKKVESVILDREHAGSRELSLDGVFIEIGSDALSSLAEKLGVKVNEKKEIVIDHKTSETNVAGVFAAGDVVDRPFKQAIVGVAEGCTAAYSAFEYLKKNK